MDYANRLNRAKRAMRERGIDLLAIPPGDDLYYLVGFSTLADERPCYLFLTPDAGFFLVPQLNAGQAEPHIRHPFLTYSDAEGPSKALATARQKLGRMKRIGVGDTMRADALLLLQQTWREAEFLNGAEVFAPLRMRKSTEEIAALERAAETADRAVEAAFAACRPGRSEAELARAATDGFQAAGVSEVKFTLVASGPNSAFPHHHTSTRRLRAGEPVLFDLGSRVDGYYSDITRMAYLGKPSLRYLEIHRVVEDAVQAALAAIKPGAPIKAVDLAAKQVIEGAGYGEFFTHRTGHGIGLSGHEPPSVTHTNDLAQETGMAFSVEPGIYFPEEFGVRLEDILVVTEEGGKRLSKLSRDIHVIQA